MPLRDHLIHSFVLNGETEAQLGQWMWPSLAFELVLILFLLQHMGFLFPLAGSIAGSFAYVSTSHYLS